MLESYFRAAWRSLSKNKASSFINIGGLAVGMAVVLLIGLWISNERSYNALPIPLANELHSDFSGDFTSVVLTTATESHLLSSGDKKFIQQGSYMQPEALSWWIFAGAGALFITLLTVSFQAIKAATANPVNTLRAE